MHADHFCDILSGEDDVPYDHTAAVDSTSVITVLTPDFCATVDLFDDPWEKRCPAARIEADEAALGSFQPREYKVCSRSRCVRQVRYRRSMPYRRLSDVREIARSAFSNGPM